MGTTEGTRTGSSEPEAVARQRSDGPRPSAPAADTPPAGTVLVPAALAGATARVLRRAVASGRYRRGPLIGQVAGTLEVAAVAPQPAAAYVIRAAGQPDTVAIPAELAGPIAEALDAGFLDIARVDRCTPPRDLARLRDRLRRAPLIADLRGSEFGTDVEGSAHDAPVDHLTVAQLADRRGCTPTYVRRLCRQGRIDGAYRAGGTWLIPTSPKGNTC